MSSFGTSFGGHDFGPIAHKAGMACTVCVLGLGILGLFFAPWISVYVIFVALLLATFELPNLYALFPGCRQAYDVMLDKLYLSAPAVRAVVFVALSIFTFTEATLQILSGLLMLLTALLYIAAQLQGHSYSKGSDQQPPPPVDGAASGSTPFGTFT